MTDFAFGGDDFGDDITDQGPSASLHRADWFGANQWASVRPQDGNPKRAMACWSVQNPVSGAYPTSASRWPCVKFPMIALDTNILARFYVDDPNDPEELVPKPEFASWQRIRLSLICRLEKVHVPG